MDGMLVIGMTVAAAVLAVLLVLQLRRRYGARGGYDGDGTCHGNHDDGGGGDGGGGD